MTNPYGITEVDVPGALNALEAARSNRIRQMLLQRQIAQQERALEAQQGVRAAVSRYTGGGDTGAASAATPAAPTMGDAVSMYGGTPEATPAATPTAMPAAVPQLPAAPAGHGDLNRLTTDLMAVDPEHAPQIIQAFRQMDEAQFTAAQRRNTVLARAAYTLISLPEAERSAAFQRMAPDLVENGGVTRQQLAGFELTEENLRHVINQARDVEKLAEEARPRPITVTQGGSVIDANNIDPTTGRPRVMYESPTIEVGGDVYTRPDAMRQAPPSEATLRQQAAEAIRNGADPAQVNQRLEQMLQGGAGQPGPQTFP